MASSERFEDVLRRRAAHGTVALAKEDADRLADLVAAVRGLRDAPRDGSVDISALHRQQQAALAALDEEAARA